MSDGCPGSVLSASTRDHCHWSFGFLGAFAALAVKLKLPGCKSLSLIQIYVSTLDITTSIAAHRPLASTSHPKSAFARPSLRVARS